MVFRFLFSLGLLVSSVVAFGSETTDHFGIPWCVDRQASIDKNQLRCLHSMDVSQAVRKAFNDLVQRKNACPSCKSTVTYEEKFFSLLHLPFLVVAIDLGRQGGYEVYIIFKDSPPQQFVVQMNYVDTDHYSPSVISNMNRSQSTSALVKKLKQKEYDPYWI